jgi:hypothetical protein
MRRHTDTSSTPDLTRHAQKRVQQRGLSMEDLALVMAHGERVDDGYLMSGKAVAARECALRRELQRIGRLRGVAVITADTTMVTVYRASKQRVRRLRRGSVTRPPNVRTNQRGQHND